MMSAGYDKYLAPVMCMPVRLKIRIVTDLQETRWEQVFFGNNKKGQQAVFMQ